MKTMQKSNDVSLHPLPIVGLRVGAHSKTEIHFANNFFRKITSNSGIFEVQEKEPNATR